MTAQIIPIGNLVKRRPPVSDRSCFNCDNAYIGRDGVICEISRQLLDDPTAAEDCDAYEHEDS